MILLQIVDLIRHFSNCPKRTFNVSVNFRIPRQIASYEPRPTQWRRQITTS